MKSSLYPDIIIISLFQVYMLKIYRQMYIRPPDNGFGTARG